MPHPKTIRTKDLGSQAWQGVISMMASISKEKFTFERGGGRNKPMTELHNGAGLGLNMRLITLICFFLT